MTHTLTRPITQAPRWHRSVMYDVLLLPVGLQTLADAVLGEPETAARRWRRLGEYRTGHAEVQPTSNAGTFGYGLLSAVLGLAALFVLFLTVLAIVRGPFWGLVEHGPVEPGTWGGPSRAGAWLAHGVIALPCIVAFLFVLRGIAVLQTLLVQGTRKWVLPATIVLAAGTCAFFFAWLQQV
ncbi:hypothetical protein GCM10009630_17220 [Kribbella jejuensis]|uniref:Uncharacterized protein n=1 Tax=Kribbella jejuensis TaxID=236068 RepID=A0A542EM71_9ACTN|nr:hypothetical protein [Kribbella jejuensis]TQJ16306.1 hypothetical protein FB475_0399 [Kribbella jejuensis]